MTLSETWLDESISNLEVCPDIDMTIVRKDRNRRGGGVAIVVRFRLCSNLSEGDVESLLGGIVSW